MKNSCGKRRWARGFSTVGCYYEWSQMQKRAEHSKNSHLTVQYGGRRWRSWLKHCVTSRKVGGSIPDGVIGIFHWHNPRVDSGIFTGGRGKGGRCVGLTTLPPSWAECLEIWELQPAWNSPALYRGSFTFTFTLTLPWSIFHILNHSFTEYVCHQQWDFTATVCCNNR